MIINLISGLAFIFHTFCLKKSCNSAASNFVNTIWWQCRVKSQNLHWSGFWKFLSRQYARLILNIIFFLQFNICISKILFLKPFISHICCANFDPLISYSCTKNIFWVFEYFQTLSRDHFEIFSCQLLTLYRITAYFNIICTNSTELILVNYPGSPGEGIHAKSWLLQIEYGIR